MSEAAILRGYHFMPSEEELVGILMAFLECRAQGKQFPQSPVAEKVMYGDNATPWMIFGEDDHWESAESDCGKKGVKDVLFVLSQLSSMSTKKKARTAGIGTWDGQTGIKEIMNRNGEVIGLRKMLTYRLKEGIDPQPDKGQWRLHEYALAGVSLEEMKLKNIYPDNYVICKVTRDYSKCESPTKDKILGKRKSEVGAEISQNQNKKLRGLMGLVNCEAQKHEINEQHVVSSAPEFNNMHPPAYCVIPPAYCIIPPAAGPGFHQWTDSLRPVESTVNDSSQLSAAEHNFYLPSAAESGVNYSHTSSAAEACSDNCVIPPAAEEEVEAEVGTTSVPEGEVDDMKKLDQWFFNLVDSDWDIDEWAEEMKIIRAEILPS